MVDDEGKPLVVYHGSDNRLNVITPGYSEPGAWFTSDALLASNYAHGSDGQVHSVYLRSTNPFVVRFEYLDGDFAAPVPVVDGVRLDIDSNVGIVEEAISRGFDGVHFPDGNFSESSETFVVFEPTQIKSATGNSGAFSPMDPDIRRSLAPDR